VKENKKEKKEKKEKNKYKKSERKKEKTETNVAEEPKAASNGSVKRKQGEPANGSTKRMKLNSGESVPAVTAKTPSPLEVLPTDEWRKKHFVDAPANTPDPIQRFEDLTVSENVMKAVLSFKHTTPTPIQSQAWPVALAGTDMIGIAETGSGKTLAYLIPAIVKLLELHAQKKIIKGHPAIIVLAPTRELAQQIEQVAIQLVRPLFLRTACFYGGAPRSLQMRRLREGVDIAIGTPGRVIDFIESGRFELKHIMFVVLDEADRMLDMGFEPQIATILRTVPPHQTLMFSATWPKEVRALAIRYQNNPVKITIGNHEHTSNKNIQQIVKVLEGESKAEVLSTLVKEIFKDGCRMLCFTNTKVDCAHYAQLLWDMGLPSNAIHGDMDQYQRNTALGDFKSGKFPILFATDVAARGLDVKGVEYVINVDFPNSFENYIHRIGRTGRAGQKGIAYSLYTNRDVDAHMLVDAMRQAGPGSEPDEKLLKLAMRPHMSREGYSFARRSRLFDKFGRPQENDSFMDDSIEGWGRNAGRGGGRSGRRDGRRGGRGGGGRGGGGRGRGGGRGGRRG